jgi:hypothetical protein
MKRILLTISMLTGLLLFTLKAQQPVSHRDGKLLQGEEWLRFDYPGKADFYVSVTGNDNWSGTLPEANAQGTDGPFLTIERAQKAVRKLKTEVYFPKDAPVEKRWIGSPHPFGRGKDILVYIRDGYYYLDKPISFEPVDGGERVETNLPTGAFEYHKLKDHYVTYAAYPGEKPVIAGEKQVVGWRISKNLWTAGFASDTAAGLIIDGKMKTLARTPNTGYFIPPEISGSTDEIHFNKGELKNWKDLAGNRVVMLLRWQTGINSIVSIDEKKNLARFKTAQDGIILVPPRYYIENVKSLLDAPGEWFYDKTKRELEYIPSESQADPSKVNAGIPVLDRLITIEGKTGEPVRNLRIYGLTFEGTTAGNSAISMKFAHACEVADNDIRSCAGTGISIKEGCYQTRILDNSFETIDNGGVYATGLAKPADGREITRETLISYNKFRNCGGNNIYANYTLLTTISHNYITKTRGRYGIDVGSWASQEEAIDGCYTVEYNHLDDVQLGADDSGAIKTAGMTFNSVVRDNLINNVNAGFFNDNVGFWFDNMSAGWTAERNIFYNLQQGEMKLCAAMIEDNTYRENFTIEAPANKPEIIIDGNPVFTESNLAISASATGSDGSVIAGSSVHCSADVFNSGSTGIADVDLYLDGKVLMTKKFPVIKDNTRTIGFDIRIYDQGEHTLAIGSTPYKTIKVSGLKPVVVFEDFTLSVSRLLEGEQVRVSAVAKNLTDSEQKIKATLFIDNNSSENTSIALNAGESRSVSFSVGLSAGTHTLRIGNSSEKSITVFRSVPIDISTSRILQYCSAKAKPYSIISDPEANKFTITASGSDFYHAEDSYAATYIKGIKGDFVATVTITAFGERTHEWFRSGLFVRNDITKSFDVQPGSKGSVLVFGTPGRGGIEYDEFANGCMHKASSRNLPENSKTPIYLKLVRHGSSFSGYISLDGKNWIIERHTSDIPGLADAVDIGLAAGGPDKRQYTVRFSDWKIEVAGD